VSSAGTFTAKVVDANNCTVQETVTVTALPTATSNVTSKLINCGANGVITFSEPQSTVSYTYEYSIDGNNFQSGREFTNLVPGKTYTPTLRYKFGTEASCTINSTRTMRTATAGNLIASAGVEKLVGCGTGVNEDKALVRFSNVQGGQLPYEYNFGDGRGWTATETARWLAPGSYNLSVRDAAGCARTNLKVIVPNKITELGLARTFQNIRLFKDMTVLENVLVGLSNKQPSNFFASLLRLPKYYSSEERLKAKAMKLLAIFNLDGEADTLAKNLAYGQQRHLEIVRALATEPKILFLDEPAAGMNPQETAELTAHIRQIQKDFGITIILIEHDMSLVMDVTERIYVLEYGRLIAEGTPDEIKNNKRVIEAYLGGEA